MGIAYSTLREWRDKFSALSAALKKGKAPVDIEVENALLKRAKGFYEVKEKRIEKWKDADGVEREHTVIITREVPPDTTALIFWLKNRRPDKWRDKPQAAEVAIDDPLLELFRRMDEDVEADVQS